MPPLNFEAGQALKHQTLRPYNLHFGESFAELPPLTYKLIETIQDPVKGAIRHFRFSNGMDFYGLVRRNVPLTSYGELYRTGSGNESERSSGISHFLEHLIFKGTPNVRPGEFDRRIENAGSAANAFTWLDMTFYYNYDTPKDKLTELIPLRSEVVMNPLIELSELNKERFTVAEEINRSQNDMNGRVFDQLIRMIFRNHPYRRDVLGPKRNILDPIREILNPDAMPAKLESYRRVLTQLSKCPDEGIKLNENEQLISKKVEKLLKRRHLTPESLLAAHPLNPEATPLDEATLRKHFKVNDLSREEILTYYAQHYNPSNMAIIAIGDYDEQQILDTIATSYNRSFPPTSEGREFLQKIPKSHAKKELAPPFKTNTSFIREEVPITTMMAGMRGPTLKPGDSLKPLLSMDLLSIILGGYEASRLNEDLVEKKRIASDASSGSYWFKEGSLFYFSTQTPPRKLAQVQRELKQHLQNIIDTGVSAEELEIAKTQWKLGNYRQNQRQSTLIGDLAVALGADALNNPKQLLENTFNELEAITPEDIQALAKEYLSPDKLQVAAIKPPKKKREPKDVPTSPQFSGRLRAEDRSIALKGGGELIIRPMPHDKIVSASIRIKGGNQIDGNLLGVTDFMAGTLARGTQSKEYLALAKELAQRGINFRIGSTAKTLQVSVTAPKEKTNDLFQFLTELLTAPGFRQKDLSQVKRLQHDDHEAAFSQSPTYAVNLLLHEAMFPQDHAYGVTQSRLSAHAKAIKPKDILAKFKELLTTQNMTIAVTGDVNPEEVQVQVEQLVSKLPDHQGPNFPTPQPLSIPQSKIVTLRREGLKQLELSQAWAAPDIRHEDRPAMAFLNGILSDGMQGRLFQTFRESENALCYRVASRYLPETGSFTTYIGTAPENFTKVQALFKREFDKLCMTPPTSEEMARILAQLTSSFASAEEASTDVSAQLASHRGGNTDSLDELLEKLEKVTPQDIQRVAQKYLTKPSITAIVAPKAILEANGLPVDGERVLQ